MENWRGKKTDLAFSFDIQMVKVCEISKSIMGFNLRREKLAGNEKIQTQKERVGSDLNSFLTSKNTPICFESYTQI